MQSEANLAAAYMSHLGSDSKEEHLLLEEVNRLTIEDPEAAWKVIQAMISLASSDQLLAYIGAGPLEDLLRRNGPKVIDQIERSIGTQQDLQFAICCVWIDQKFPVCSRVHELAREFGPGLRARLTHE